MSDKEQVKTPKASKKYKLISYLTLSAFFLIVIFLITFIYTSAGIKLTAVILEKALPQLKITKVNGAFNDLEIDKLSLEFDGLRINIDNASLSLSMLCLLEAKLCVKHFNASNVVIDIDTSLLSSSNDDIEQASELALKRFLVSTPIPIDLKNAIINKATVNVDDMQFGFSEFKGNAIWINEKIYVYPDKFDGLHAIFADKEKPQITNNKTSTDFTFDLEQTLTDIFKKPILDALPDVSIPLDIYINELKGTNWLLHIGGEDHYFNDVIINGSVENNYIKVKNLNTYAISPYAKGKARVDGDITLGGNWPVSANIKAITDANKFSSPTTLTGNIKGNIVGVLSADLVLNGDNDATFAGSIDLNSDWMPLNLQLKSKKLQWPILSQPIYQAKNIDLDFSGNILSHQLKTKFNADVDSLKNVYLDVSLANKDFAFDLKKFTLKLNEGIFDAVTKLDLKQGFAWNGKLDINRLDLNKEWLGVPIKLDGQFSSNGYINKKDFQASFSEIRINGHIDDKIINLNGNLDADNKHIKAKDFNAYWAGNRITLNGETSNGTLDANFNLNNLSALQTDFQGNLKGNIRVKGSYIQPILDADLILERFVYQNTNINNASIKGEVKYNNIFSGNIDVFVSDVAVGDRLIDKIQMSLSGSENDHYVDMLIESKNEHGSLHFNGNLNHDSWLVNVLNAELFFNETDKWLLKDKLLLDFDLKQRNLSINEHCWNNAYSNFCLVKKTNINDKAGEATLSINHVDLNKIFASYLNETKITGNMDGIAVIKWQNFEVMPYISVNLDSRNIHVVQKIASQYITIPIEQFNVSVLAEQSRAKVNLLLNTKNYGKINGAIYVDDFEKKQNLSGNLLIDKLALSIFNPLLSDDNSSNDAKGTINGNLGIGGVLSSPELNGELIANYSDIRSNQLPVDIRNLNLKAKFEGKNSKITGVIGTDAGNVNLTGQLSWQEMDNWHADMNIKGKAINISYSPEINISAEPDLDVVFSEKNLSIIGSITIPNGLIKVKSLPSSVVDISSDEIIFNDQLNEIKKYDFGIDPNIKVQVKLGNNILVDAFGLNAKLAGVADIEFNEKGLITNGKIEIIDGKYAAYFQDLIINKGEIFLAGTPEQARLNIEAIRNPETINGNVKVGVRISGTIDLPSVKVFSDPVMAQDEAVAYLIKGESFSGSTSDVSDAITSLLFGFITSTSNDFIKNFVNITGVKNLFLDTQGVGEQRQVVVKGSLFQEKLQVKYGIGLFDALSTLTVRYEILPRLYLEGVAGINKTIDLIYQFDF